MALTILINQMQPEDKDWSPEKQPVLSPLKSVSELLREEANVPDLLSYDFHLECVLQELTTYAKSIEQDAIEENVKLKVPCTD